MKRYIRTSTQPRVRFADWKIRDTIDKILDNFVSRFSEQSGIGFSSTQSFLVEELDTWKYRWFQITISGKCPASVKIPNNPGDLYVKDLGIKWGIKMTTDDESDVVYSGDNFNTIRDAQIALEKALKQRKDFNIFNPDLMNGL